CSRIFMRGRRVSPTAGGRRAGSRPRAQTYSRDVVRAKDHDPAARSVTRARARSRAPPAEATPERAPAPPTKSNPTPPPALGASAPVTTRSPQGGGGYP